MTKLNHKRELWTFLKATSDLPEVSVPVYALIEIDFIDESDPQWSENNEPWVAKLIWDKTLWKLVAPTEDQDEVLLQEYSVICWRYV